MSEFTKMRKRTKFMLSAGALGLLSATIASPALAQQTAEPVDFDIPSKELSAALKDYSIATDQQVIFAVDLVRDKRAPAVSGAVESGEALTRLLKDTGLSYERTDSNVIVIKPLQQQAMLVQEPARIATLQDVEERNEETEADDRSDRDQPRRRDEITVTGTLIKGIAPESSPVLEFNRDDISKSGAQDLDQFLRTIPQTFGGGASNIAPGGFAGDLDASANFSSLSSTVNLRGLGGNATLTLLNGRRLAPSGGSAAFVDVSSIPLNAIDRVEVLADGASSIYGADAVAGVINFILRDDFEGLESLIDYGVTTEGDFERIRASQTAGVNWGSGNAMVAYDFFDQNPLYASEKSFAQSAADPFSLVPGQTRHSVTGSVSQSLSSDITGSLMAYYGHRDTDSVANFLGQGAVIIDRQVDASQLLLSPSLSVALPGTWSIKVTGDYSRVSENADEQRFSSLTGDLRSTNETSSKSHYYASDLVADGSLLALPGGEISLAVGGSFRSESFDRVRSGQRLEVNRDVYAAFGEIYVPFVSAENRITGIERLELSASGRYDNYSDVGSTINPKVGLLWSPVGGLNLRSSFGTSFTPPTLTERPGDYGSAALLLLVDDPSTGLRDLTAILLNNGYVSELKPESSRSFTAGFDVERQVGNSNFSLNATYYDIAFKDRIAPIPLPPGASPFNALLYADQIIDGTITLNPTTDEVDTLIDAIISSGSQLTDFVERLTGTPGNVSDVAALFDFRIRNIARTETRGVDFGMSLAHELEAGTVLASLSGDRIIEFFDKGGVDAPEVDAFDRIFRPAKLRLRGGLGFSNNRLSLNSFVNFTSAYTDDRTPAAAEVSSWTTLDLSASYEVSADDGVLSGLKLAVSVQNLLDTDPPFVLSDNLGGPSNTAGSFDPANASPLGRLLAVQLVKRW